jgi:hypothetical protein
VRSQAAVSSSFVRSQRRDSTNRGEVAKLAAVSIEYYTRLEPGNLAGVSEDVLEAISRALQLDEAERAHLFDLARADSPDLHPHGVGRSLAGWHLLPVRGMRVVVSSDALRSWAGHRTPRR